jgi:hypothetical protein
LTPALDADIAAAMMRIAALLPVQVLDFGPGSPDA